MSLKEEKVQEKHNSSQRRSLKENEILVQIIYTDQYNLYSFLSLH